MMGSLFSVVFRFILGGLSAFFSEPSDDANSNTVSPLTTLIDSLREEKQEATNILVPFEEHMARNFDPDATNNTSVFIESLTGALNDLGKEIKQIVPDSTFTTSVNRSGGAFEGHLDWKVETPTKFVYPICLDLLSSGFVFRVDTKTFVVTTRISE